MTEEQIGKLIDAITNAVDDWVRAGGGTYDELQAVIEAVVRRLLAAK